ncbi:DUF1566 domain-containing protein [bacterium]|nr:DUF1566 domain-containing protein [bacterium]
MKKLCLVLMLLFSFEMFAEQLTVRIYYFENQTEEGKYRLNENTIKNMADKVRSELVKAHKFKILSVSKMDNDIKQLIKESQNLDRNSDYAVKLGNRISANYIITGHINNVDEDYTVVAEMIDLSEFAAYGSGNADFQNNKPSRDKAIESLVKQILGEEVAEEKSEAQMACERTRIEGTSDAWKIFIDLYSAEPEVAKCVREGKILLEKQAYEDAISSSDIQILENYIRDYPSQNKMHIMEARRKIAQLKKQPLKSQAQKEAEARAAEADARRKAEEARLAAARTELERKRMEEERARRAQAERIAAADEERRRQGILEWSSSYREGLSYNVARQYCENLSEGGHNDWRLPTIDEWRSTFQKCPETQPGGKCQVSEKNGRLDPDAFSRACKAGCKKGYSTQSGRGWFWSSSSKQGTSHYWVVAFKNARISSLGDKGEGSVRCVR